MRTLPGVCWLQAFAVKTLLAIALGAVLGLAYYRFIGCRGGVCPIGANPYVSALYGAFLGYLMSAGS